MPSLGEAGRITLGIIVDIALAVGLVAAAAVAVRRLPIFHPATLWLAAWALASTLFAIGALPYRHLSATTAAIIAGWTALFCLGCLLGARNSVRRVLRLKSTVELVEVRHLARAAAMAAALAMLGLGAFLLQVAASYGLRAAIVSDATVRFAISGGATPYTIKYIYVAFAASALAGLAAARSTSIAGRRRWIAVAMIMIATQYFSTGRSNLLLAAVMACIAYFVASPEAIKPRRLILVASAVGVSTLGIFLGMGSLLDKSFATSDVRTFDNVFLRSEPLRPLALPYQYVTAPLPAFDVIRRATPVTGRGGCQTLRPLCSIANKLGLPVEPEPSLTGFTGPPAAWNTFTALYGPLVDGGPLFGAFIIFAEGMLFGLLWAGTRAGSLYAMSTYATMSAAVVYCTVENTLLQPHLIGAALIAAILIAAALRFDALASACGWQRGLASEPPKS